MYVRRLPQIRVCDSCRNCAHYAGLCDKHNIVTKDNFYCDAHNPIQSSNLKARLTIAENENKKHLVEVAFITQKEVVAINKNVLFSYATKKKSSIKRLFVDTADELYISFVGEKTGTSVPFIHVSGGWYITDRPFDYDAARYIPNAENFFTRYTFYSDREAIIDMLVRAVYDICK